LASSTLYSEGFLQKRNGAAGAIVLIASHSMLTVTLRVLCNSIQEARLL
jgi:hypothetical protein